MANLQADITIGQRGPVGPRGPRGPQGPVGPQGANGDGTTPQLIVQTSEDTVELNPNVYYNLTLNNATDTTVYLAEGVAGLANEYLGQITVANDGLIFKIPNVQWILDSNIEYTEDTDFNIILDSGNTYLFSVVNEIGIMVVL
jgi:hypothetical protein